MAFKNEVDSLREAFYLRLQRDRVQFTVFAAALMRADSDTGRLFERLRELAHKTRGLSAMFQSLNVVDAATSLEYAAANAVSARAGGADPTVWAALVKLMDVLAKLRADHEGKSTEVPPIQGS